MIGIGSVFGNELKTRGANHESTSTSDLRGTPEQNVGSSSSGGGSCASNGLHGPYERSKRQPKPRCPSWRGSPGTPQNVTSLWMKDAVCVIFLTSTVTP